MNDTTNRFLGRTVSSEAFDIRFGQGVGYVSSVVIVGMVLPGAVAATGKGP
jgi:hypothetical protein